jgi:hypothetical protein
MNRLLRSTGIQPAAKGISTGIVVVKPTFFNESSSKIGFSKKTVFLDNNIYSEAQDTKKYIKNSTKKLKIKTSKNR